MPPRWPRQPRRAPTGPCWSTTPASLPTAPCWPHPPRTPPARKWRPTTSGTLAMCRAFAPLLTGNSPGALVTVLSTASCFTNPAMGSYSASKAAAWALTNGIRSELHNTGVLVAGAHCGHPRHGHGRPPHSPQEHPGSDRRAHFHRRRGRPDGVLADERTRQAKAALGLTPATNPFPPAPVTLPRNGVSPAADPLRGETERLSRHQPPRRARSNKTSSAGKQKPHMTRPFPSVQPPGFRLHEIADKALKIPSRCPGRGQTCSLRFPTPGR
ncbi:SDR family NAD(P)-dependent oxidoreductase [Streptomyces sp. NPDC005648]|uniref:SDR family NAD(P)-dependent oxidoreductase n=1 Tax=Streptomyces sp. NPDC005648 TaxID=3157044 RepID=UPI0033B2E7D8